MVLEFQHFARHFALPKRLPQLFSLLRLELNRASVGCLCEERVQGVLRVLAQLGVELAAEQAGHQTDGGVGELRICEQGFEQELSSVSQETVLLKLRKRWKNANGKDAESCFLWIAAPC